MGSIVFLLPYNAVDTVCFDSHLLPPHQYATVPTLVPPGLSLHQYLCTRKSLHVEASHENPASS